MRRLPRRCSPRYRCLLPRCPQPRATRRSPIGRCRERLADPAFDGRHERCSGIDHGLDVPSGDDPYLAVARPRLSEGPGERVLRGLRSIYTDNDHVPQPGRSYFAGHRDRRSLASFLRSRANSLARGSTQAQPVRARPRASWSVATLLSSRRTRVRQGDLPFAPRWDIESHRSSRRMPLMSEACGQEESQLFQGGTGRAAPTDSAVALWDDAAAPSWGSGH